jgi:hypothetical protein
MLNPEDRRLYTNCFTVPRDYRFDCGVGTTFTLDLETLLFVPIALTTSGSEDPRAALADRVALLGAIHRVGERLTVFCEDGRSNTPALQHSLVSLLEESFVPARARGDGAIFHPKLWLFRFVHQETGEELVRAVVLSRNVTTSRCWDTVVQLEGTPNPRQVVSESKPLAALVRALPALVSRPELRPSSDRLAQLEVLADAAERTRFAAPTPFDQAVEFLSLGLGDGQRWKPEKGDRVLAISPFLSERALTWLEGFGAARTLVSREETLDLCDRKVLGSWTSYGLHGDTGADAESAESDLGDTVESEPHGLHAKALAIESGKRTTWWLGSANLTDPVMNATNVELLVRMEGPTKAVGITSFLEGGFQDLLRSYDLQTPQRMESAEEHAQRLVDKAQHAIVRAQLQGSCAQQENEAWHFTLHGIVPVPPGVRIEAHPLTLSAGRAVSLENATLTFSNMPLEALTAFVAFRIEAKFGEATVRAGFTCRVPVSGMPEDRLARIIRSVIEDRSSLLGYLSRLLDDAHGPIASIPSTKSKLGAGNAAGSFAQPVLLESIVRALRRNPERLLGIDRTLQRLRSEQGEGEAVVPADLIELWDTVRELVLVRAGNGFSHETFAKETTDER